MGLFAGLMQALGASRRIFALLDTAPTLELEGGATIPDDAFKGAISFVDVRFAYPSRTDGASALPAHHTSGTHIIPSPCYALLALPACLALLTQRCDGRSNPRVVAVAVLDGLTLDIAASSAVALVGSSGGGKSSVIALIERFYDPTSGGVFVDGVPLAGLDPSWWRRHVALVAQEPVLVRARMGCMGCMVPSPHHPRLQAWPRSGLRRMC